MNYYLDTSVLVAMLVSEAHSPRVLAWLDATAPGARLISDWCHTEVSSALSLKVRTGQLSLELRAAAASAWNALHAANFPTLMVLPEHFETAARFAARHDLGLRAGDALHIAIAQHAGHTLATLDQRMADAALQLGIPVETI